MVFNVAVCDDDLSDLKEVISLFSLYQKEHKEIEFNLSQFNQSSSVIDYYKSGKVFDLLFLDVDMPEANGIELSREIRRLYDPEVRIIFLSGYPSYMQNAFEVRAFRFLFKPLSYDSFARIMDEMFSEMTEANITLTLTTTDTGYRLVKLRDIVYIDIPSRRIRDNELIYHTLTDSFMVLETFSEAEKKYLEHNFISPHRGILVNMRYIKTLHTDTLELCDGKELPLSRRKLTDIKRMFSHYILSMKYQL